MVALALLAGTGGFGAAANLGVRPIPQAGPSVSSILQSVSDGGASGTDSQVTPGVMHSAVTGTTTGPLIDAAPQYKAV